MTKAWGSMGSDLIGHALRDQSVTITHSDGCGIHHAARDEFWIYYDAKSNSVRSISGGTVHLNPVRAGLDVAMLCAPRKKFYGRRISDTMRRNFIQTDSAVAPSVILYASRKEWSFRKRHYNEVEL